MLQCLLVRYIDERRVLWNSWKIWNTEVSNLVLIIRRNTMNYSKSIPSMQRSKKRPLVVIVTFSSNQSVFCYLREFFHISFQTLKLASTYVIRTLMLIKMNIQIIVACYTLVIFYLKIFCPWIKKFIFQDGVSGIMIYYQWGIVPFWCIIWSWLHLFNWRIRK